MRRIKGFHFSRKKLGSMKVRITTHLDHDIITTVRELAEDSGSKYQTILNHILRDSLFGHKKGLLARLDRLERKVFRKRAA